MLPAATDMEDWSNSFPISEKYRDSFENIVSRWRVSPLPAYDTNDQLIRIHDLEVQLRGSLVLVQFELRHYAIRDKRSNSIGTNTFSATATQIQVLERGALKNPSPYKSMMLKGPKHLPQSPSKKRDQVNAVAAFHPGDYPFFILGNSAHDLNSRRLHFHGFFHFHGRLHFHGRSG
jgi:hypothetical protein